MQSTGQAQQTRGGNNTPSPLWRDLKPQEGVSAPPTLVGNLSQAAPRTCLGSLWGRQEASKSHPPRPRPSGAHLRVRQPRVTGLSPWPPVRPQAGSAWSCRTQGPRKAQAEAARHLAARASPRKTPGVSSPPRQAALADGTAPLPPEGRG